MTCDDLLLQPVVPEAPEALQQRCSTTAEVGQTQLITLRSFTLVGFILLISFRYNYHDYVFLEEVRTKGA